MTNELNDSCHIEPKVQRTNEYFYHALMLGFLGINTLGSKDVRFVSNHESGDGYPDIMGYHLDEVVGCILELKATKDASKLDVVAEQGLMQCRIKMSIWQRTGC